MKAQSFLILSLVLISSNGFAKAKSMDMNDCLNCHDYKLKGDDPHGGVAYECTFCHAPHGQQTGYQGRLLQDINETCFSCHDDFSYGSGHPVTGHPVSGPSDKLFPEKKMTCASCHNPHGSTMPALFRYKYDNPTGKCGSCHYEMVGNGQRPNVTWE